MTAICNGTDLSSYIGQGFKIQYEPQNSESITALDGKDYTAKLRDRVKLTYPFIPLTADQISNVLQLFPQSGAYVTWTFFDIYLGRNRTIQGKYDTRASELKCVWKNGTEYYSGLIVTLVER